ncbi:MAG: transposase [Prochlorothrix sp.]|nr:transposase [Prochlorothrix sp.]
MRPYSIDLRQRIVQAWERGEGSVRGLADRFQVAPSFVHKLLKQYRETGSLEPKEHGGGNPGKITEAEEQVLRDLLEQKSDRTLEELRQALEEKHQVQVSTMTVSRVLKRLGLTRQKSDRGKKDKSKAEGT